MQHLFWLVRQVYFILPEVATDHFGMPFQTSAQTQQDYVLSLPYTCQHQPVLEGDSENTKLK